MPDLTDGLTLSMVVSALVVIGVVTGIVVFAAMYLRDES
jgi:uncharacterized membrane protein YciS (DUF1049 family)